MTIRGADPETLLVHTASIPTKPQSVSVNDIELRYQIVGQGEPLLLLHGFLGSGETWSPILGGLERLGQDYQLIIPDLRGHGGSTDPGGEFTMRQSALDIIALLDHLGIKRVKAIGMSDGGMTLLHLATRQPDRVEALVLINATTHFPEQARALMRSTTEEAQTEDSWGMMRKLHRHGDEQIRGLWRVARGFADSHMTTWRSHRTRCPTSRPRPSSSMATGTRFFRWTSRCPCSGPFRPRGCGSYQTADISASSQRGSRICS